ncbi:hypothetical protein Tco_1494407, partial [Tanacetum coccineum]
YHPTCLNMTEDEAKQLDSFTCDREQCLDRKRHHNQSSGSVDPDMVETKRPKRMSTLYNFLLRELGAVGTIAVGVPPLLPHQ